ncbi:MAG: hypothetical protein SP4CHLAM5_07240 [Chlamydiia bacterium]|nr:hypothetical protein [Chlamydiia bacterium]MCH9618591.1 hypothetical protein [Chlamydiia bacterium]MCH9623870.1 hypothetical protein [Chlamydiia bacterium]
MFKKYTLILCLFCLHLYGINYTNPSVDDFKSLQKKLLHSNSPYLNFLIWHRKGFPPYMPRLETFKSFTFVKDGQFDKDVTIVPFGDNRERVAICTYFSFNWTKRGKDIPYFIKARIENLKEQSFTGDFVYQVGGYPNVAEGDLQFYDVPYAFKLAMIRRMQRLGYKKILWLDGIIEILNPLDKVWESLDQKPVFLRDSLWSFQKNCHQHIREATHITHTEWENMTHYATNIFGLNLENTSIQKMLNQWYELAIGKIAFYSPFPEQIPVSILLQKNNIPINNSDWRTFFTFNYGAIP